MQLRDAIERRMSVRAFTSTPVEDSLLRELLMQSSRAPSGGNVQPWRLHIVNGAATKHLVKLVAGKPAEESEYPIYPDKLWEPYRTNRFRVGEMMYETMGIERDDKPARYEWLARNQQFFGAPAGMFCFVDRRMNHPQWSDLGMFLQTFMLLAVEAGLDTCAQESWSAYPQLVGEHFSVGEELMLFCGMAIGYRNPEHPVNSLRSERTSVEDFATFHN